MRVRWTIDLEEFAVDSSAIADTAKFAPVDQLNRRLDEFCEAGS